MLGRITTGVKLINLKEGVSVASIAKVVEEDVYKRQTDLRDETSREGMRIVVELRRDVNPSVVLNLLFKHTQLQDCLLYTSIYFFIGLHSTIKMWKTSFFYIYNNS